jgi:hypothetical protein
VDFLVLVLLGRPGSCIAKLQSSAPFVVLANDLAGANVECGTVAADP